MNTMFNITIPKELTSLGPGIFSYSGTKTIICEGESICEIYKKYPNAICVKQIIKQEQEQEGYEKENFTQRRKDAKNL
ncbi:MAG: hypothetical protein KAT05_16245 [Spirochaetes bacterium]|nr:hypothetical protein [Spirochaetota bacterium]